MFNIDGIYAKNEQRGAFWDLQRDSLIFWIVTLLMAS